jgi:hypothetical protein
MWITRKLFGSSEKTNLMKNLMLFLLIFTLVTSSVSSTEAADKRVRIQRNDLVGTWIGLTSDELQMVRLTLNPDGAGSLGYSYLEKDPCIYRVASWVFKQGNIELKLGHLGMSCALDREFRGVVSGNALELTIQGKGWKRSASLRREENLEDRWRMLKNAMAPSDEP